ncbi:MAG TPA: nitroreductase family protein, partial [Gammaproteobacteria bacterium]|nr:nitroreductase family protein [Gammaproteobacteria bacterium]
MKEKNSKINIDFNYLQPDEMIERAKKFYQLVNSRRSVRDFESRGIP